MKRGHRIGMAAAALLSASAGAALAIERPLEYPVKAAFLHRFASFVSWPPAALADSRSMTLCVVGRDPFGALLDRTLENQSIGGRAVELRRMAAISPSSGCHIAYLGGSPDQSVEQALDALAGSPVLTVTDDQQTSAMGMIHFVIVANRVRFSVDERRARRSDLVISSKLLNLAVRVVR
ncbi:MAG: YfiR family protein [Phenylobacterium sp.]|uniref:YfiR family protein n=1 Tax=Phenylobacterium sp. TaxID=1871053 RepID=UPI003919AF1A